MRYERLKDIIDLAVRLQGSRGGVTLDDIQQELSVSGDAVVRGDVRTDCDGGLHRADGCGCEARAGRGGQPGGVLQQHQCDQCDGCASRGLDRAGDDASVVDRRLVGRWASGTTHHIRFRCRVIAVDPGTGLPEPGEEPADMVNGLVHGAGPDTVLAEFDCIDRPPAEETLVALLDTAADALGEDQIKSRSQGSGGRRSARFAVYCLGANRNFRPFLPVFASSARWQPNRDYRTACASGAGSGSRVSGSRCGQYCGNSSPRLLTDVA